MNWYLTKLVYQIISGEGNHTAQFDEQLRLIMAQTPVEAFQKAQTIGKAEEEIFFNRNRQPVRWQFIDISELQLIPSLGDGTEIYSRIEEKESADSYIHIVRKKSQAISNGKMHPLLNLV